MKILRIIFLLIFIIIKSNAFSQILFDYNLNYSRQIEINPDSIFAHFEYPDLDSIMTQSNPFSYFFIISLIEADTNRRVASINFYRINELSDSSISSETWNEIEQSIKKISTKWIFQNLEWNNNNLSNTDLLNAINEMNNSKQSRNKPFNNQGYYILCFYYDRIFHHSNPITIFSTIRL